MKKIKDFYNSIPSDKRLHFWVGFIIAMFFGLIFASDGHEFNHIERGVAVGFGLACLAGAAKELVWDLALGKGQFDHWDFVATAFGGGVAVALFGITLDLIS